MNQWVVAVVGLTYLILGSAAATALGLEDRWLAWALTEVFWPWLLLGLVLMKLIRILQQP